MFDQRGTGAGALDCPALQGAAGASDLTVVPPATVSACARSIGPDRRYYTTSETVADIGSVCAQQRCGWDPAADLAAVVKQFHDGPALLDALVADSVGAHNFPGVLDDLHSARAGRPGALDAFLADDFPDAYLRIFDLSHGDVAYMRDDVAIPLEPFFGTMGVCPAGAKAQPVMPPGNFGGNMDTRQLVRGSTLYLPVQVERALFSCGDAHGAQGDGEVCVTGLEAPMFASLRFTLEKGRSIRGPQYRTPAPLTPRVNPAPFYGTTGVGGDLYVAAQDAVRAMVDHVSSTYELGREDAYLLCSLVADLKISEIVDAGQYIVSAVLPEAVFAR
jgi:acetamidase/formamidase